MAEAAVSQWGQSKRVDMTIAGVKRQQTEGQPPEEAHEPLAAHAAWQSARPQSPPALLTHRATSTG